jgi:lipoate-protein ligase A
VHEPVTGLKSEICCWVLPHDIDVGPANMALDDALLEAVASGARAAYLRTYGWATPTLSLGYFQKLADARSDPRFRGVPIVRRLTGGGAIWHHHEVTYALVIPANHPLARPSMVLYRAVHTTIAAALARVGVAATRHADCAESGLVYETRPLLCFTDHGPEDIVTKGAKVLGSAQRRRGGAVLQHGSLLLARSPRTPELLGVCDVADELLEHHDWSGRLLAQIPDALGLRRMDVEVPREVRERATDLRRGRYENAHWNGLR